MSLAVQLDRADHRVGAGAPNGGALSARVSRAARGHQWPDGVMAMPAAELFDLESPSAAEAIRSLIDLCLAFGRDEFLLMDLAGLSDHASGHFCARRIEMLKALIVRICSRDLLALPQFELEILLSQADLRVRLSRTYLASSPTG
jgi:hypothetical protein